MTPEQKAVLRDIADRLQERVDELMDAIEDDDAVMFEMVLELAANQIEQAQIDLEVTP